MNQAQQRLECQSRPWIGAVIVAGVAAFVRGAVLAAALLGIAPLANLGEDPDSYREIAQTLAQSGTFGITAEAGRVDPTAFRPPLYPWLLSWGAMGGQLGNASVALLHWVVGVLTCLGVYATLRPCSNNRVAIAAGCLTAIDPLLLMQSTLVMTETLAAGLAVAAWWAATKCPLSPEENRGDRSTFTLQGFRDYLWGRGRGEGANAAGYGPLTLALSAAGERGLENCTTPRGRMTQRIFSECLQLGVGRWRPERSWRQATCAGQCSPSGSCCGSAGWL